MIMEGIQPGISANPYTTQFGQPSYPGNVAGAPFGGVIGSGIGGLFTNPAVGRQVVDGVSTPFYGDLATVQYQQAQLARQAQLMQLAQLAQLAQQLVQQVQLAQLAQQHPQGVPGNLAGYGGQPFGQVFGGVANPMAGLQAGFGIGQPGRLTPFGVDPITALQQAQLQQLQLQQLQQAALLAQQPQGWAGNILGHGGAWGYPQPTGQIGGPGYQFGRPLPYQTTPFGMTAPFGVSGGYIPAF